MLDFQDLYQLLVLLLLGILVGLKIYKIKKRFTLPISTQLHNPNIPNTTLPGFCPPVIPKTPFNTNVN